MLENYFKLGEHNTNARTEIMAGVTTFFTMAYILVVNPIMISEGAAIINEIGIPGAEDPAKVFNGVFFATCIASFIGTLMMALYAKIPFAQAPGMGLNAFFAYTVMAGFGYLYSQALGIVFISGLLFMLLTVTGLRKTIVDCIPKNIKIAISAGIGLFLAFLGLQSAGLVVADGATLVGLVSFASFRDPEMRATIMVPILSFIGLLIIGILSARRIKGAILIGIVATTLIGIPMGVTQLPGSFAPNIGAQFGDFVEVSLFNFAGGLASLFQGQALGSTIAQIAVLVISFSLVDMFDTIGTLLGTAKRANLLDENGNMENINQALMCDAVATTAGAMVGSTTVTTFVESAAGIGEGGRTGLTSLTTAILFLLAIVLAPFVGIIPGAATAPALIYVGSLMIAAIKDIDWSEVSESVPAFMTIAMMPLTYSIANGIAFGLISYTAIKLCSGKVKEIHPVCAALAVIFIIRFFLI